MADETPKPLIIAALMGRNGSDTNFFIDNRQCKEARNVDWFRSSLGRRRGGAAKLTLTSTGTAFATSILFMYRHLPTRLEGDAQFWVVDGASVFHFMANAATFADPPSISDAINSSPQEVVGQSFNAKSPGNSNLYLAYDVGAVNRLHLAEKSAGGAIRRVGLATPTAAPTNAPPVAGAVTATRMYRASFTQVTADGIVRRSNLGPTLGPIALVAQQAVFTQPALAGEGETNWELWEAQDASFADYRLIGSVATGNTITDNQATQPTTVAPDEGANTPPPAARYIVVDDSRVIMGGAWTLVTGTGAPPSDKRIWWTSRIGSSDAGDAERISLTLAISSYADVDESIAGISQPLQAFAATVGSSLERGSFYVFSYRSQWKFVSTGDASAPYIRFKVQGGRGTIHHKSIVVAEDMNGSPTVMWASADGIMRMSAAGQEFMGEDVVDIWARINLAATIPCHSVFVPALHQVWFYIAIDGSTYPNFRLVFDTRLGRMTADSGVRHGWSTADGESTKAYCSSLFSNTVGATMSRDLKPYIGYTGAVEVWKCDTTDQDDAGSTFQAYIDTKSYAPWGLGRKGGTLDDVKVVADAQPGVSVTLTIYRDEGAEAKEFQVNLTPPSDSGQETMVFPKAAGSQLTESHSFRCRIGDQAATSSAWNLHALVVPVTPEGTL